MTNVVYNRVIRAPYIFGGRQRKKKEKKQKKKKVNLTNKMNPSHSRLIWPLFGGQLSCRLGHGLRNRLSCGAQSQQAQATRRSECGHLSARLKGAV
ncbi:hypothetical protein OS493_039732 [Desmophyllum pertusum]|uniref:Uncharacterized protein n=1 Tax=Desmophyllum pertusum TaxID=174260 RepID=A0A9W9YTQ1_9CNID|nr:hypothetical protein OS493_039732 [Desmophyllum pertusum]